MKARITPTAATTLCLLLSAGTLAACGGGDDDGDSSGAPGSGPAEELARCIDATDARAGTAESVLEGAVGAVDMLGPSAVIHVFETPADAAKQAEPEPASPKTQIDKVVVYSDDPEVLKLVKGCL